MAISGGERMINDKPMDFPGYPLVFQTHFSSQEPNPKKNIDGFEMGKVPENPRIQVLNIDNLQYRFPKMRVPWFP